ncbi:MAG: tetratricopeptide repeat protein [Muribaculaceae bacterium]|nr:tetratricopeptide repeat protein [Muribaculaceae bacterium]
MASIIKHTILSLAIASTGLTSQGQVAASPERFSPLASGYMERARTMLNGGNYAGVIDQLSQLTTRGVILSPEQHEEMIFMLAQAYFERGDETCLALLRDFVREYPASTRAIEAKLSIADFYFFNHRWPEALTEYDAIDFDRLNRADLPLYNYRRMLAQIKTGHYQEAKVSLEKIRHNARYAQAYVFYSAYLDYIDGDYDKAYEGFSKVKSGTEGLEASYYLTQIDYKRGEYERASEAGKRLLVSLKDPGLAPELNRITGLSFFKLGNDREARQYLNRYVELTESDPAHDAVYALGVADYNDGETDRAAERFASLTELNNDIAQSAWLYLGQCDVKAGNDDAAAIAFEKAARMDYDRDVSEVALYNYVAALTRGGKVPFASSVDMLEGFIKLYPHSEYTPKVEEYLATAYYNEHNYSKALANIEKIRKPSNAVLAAKQKILYELGIEAMTNGRPEDAVTYLKRSLDLATHDRELARQTQLWLGDAQYSLTDYQKAVAAYKAFLNGEKNSSNRTLALYNMAYALYQQENYKQAAKEFSNALKAQPELPSALASDALIRMADCEYYTGDYTSARNNYARAVSENAADADYATYRHAVMLGLGGDVKGKIKELTEMESKWPESRWLPNAMLEKALTYEATDQTAKAAEAFNALASKYPKSAQARKAMLNLALTYSKAGKATQAADTYKEIIRTWPSSEEASMAHDDLRKYYSSRGELAEYAQFLQTVPEARQLDANEMEQLAFDGAETAFAENNNSITLLRNYVRDYPDGKYLAPALLDIATSLRMNEKYTEAEETLQRLASVRPHSVQYPEALLMRAEILEYDLPGRSPEAAEVYKALAATGEKDFMGDALAGVARTAAADSDRIEYARKARSTGGLGADQAEDMQLIEAEALLNLKRDSEALEILAQLSANPAGEAGAKAAVRMGQYYVDHKEWEKAEKVLSDFTGTGTSHEFYLAKGFILLADVYKGQGKNYLAKEYLQTLKENYPGNEPEILNAISSRLKAINN